jgi:hypothetical protein
MEDDMSEFNEGPIYVKSQQSPEVEGASNIALWLEIIFGIFGLLGIGHVYTGRTGLGILLAIGYWLYIAFATFVTTVTVGFAACLFVPLHFAIPIISGIQARTYAQKVASRGNWGSVALVGGLGCVVLIVVPIVLIFSLGLLGTLSSEMGF